MRYTKQILIILGLSIIIALSAIIVEEVLFSTLISMASDIIDKQ